MKRNTNEPSIAHQHLDRAYFHEANGNLEQALAECDLIVSAEPSLLTEAYNLRGIILDGLGRREEAADAYREALAFNPSFQEAADNLRELNAEIARQHNLVTIASFCQPAQVQQMKTQLWQGGIWSVITEERESGVAAIFWGSWRGMKLQVKEQDTHKALEILGVEPSLPRFAKGKKSKSTSVQIATR
jgi:tetratricopeptide (TPR) repeat protein